MFLTVARTLNFSAAARELFCTQPALSYQIRSLEQELNVTLLRRSTTHVKLTDAGSILLPRAHQLYHQMLTTRAALKPYARERRLVLRLPHILLQRDPIYPVLVHRLHAALPSYELAVDTAHPRSACIRCSLPRPMRWYSCLLHRCPLSCGRMC